VSVDMQDRNQIAADLLQCNGKTAEERTKQVRQRATAMAPAERRSLTDRIDGVLAWVEGYEAEEILINGRAS
jgi:hypothetical protein